MTTIGPDGRFLQQLQWRPVPVTPTEMLGIQMLLVQVALTVGFAEVDKSIKRVEGKVESVLKLVKAERTGEVVGNWKTVERLVTGVRQGQPLPTVDFLAIAGLGPALTATVEQLRTHVRSIIGEFDPELSVRRELTSCSVPSVRTNSGTL